ncbi:42948_t:CDS:1, partial [Gigaspora margarita]
MTKEYNTAVKEFKDLSKYNLKYLIRTQIDMNINLMQQKKQIIDKYKEEIRSFQFVYWLLQIDKL